MNELRPSYSRLLPIVFSGALAATILEVYHHTRSGGHSRVIEVLIGIIRYGAVWTAIGLAFRQFKAAAIALGVTLLLFFADNFLLNGKTHLRSALFNDLYSLLFNDTFLPGLVFGLLCFKKPALRYFLPLCVLSYGITLLFTGGCFLDASPYNAWYNLLYVDRLAKILSENSHRYLSIKFYVGNFISPFVIFLLLGECYMAAAGNKKIKELFHIDLATHYTKTGAIFLFYILRIIINLLVIGLLIYPLVHFYDSYHILSPAHSLFNLMLVLTGGLALLTAVVLYYRKFLIEYFIASHQKVQWLFWIVNIPILGWLVLPFLPLIADNNTTLPNRTRFFYDEARYDIRPSNIMWVMLAIGVISALSGGMSVFSLRFWFICIVGGALFIWYASSVTGFYVILALGLAWLIFFLTKQSIFPCSPYNSTSLNYDPNFPFWFLAAFSVVQYTVLFPVFHFIRLKAVQENKELAEELTGK